MKRIQIILAIKLPLLLLHGKSLMLFGKVHLSHVMKVKILVNCRMLTDNIFQTFFFFIPGQKFALLEEKVMLSSIFRNFHVKSCQTSEELFPIAELILRPGDGIEVILTNRRKETDV